MPCGDCGGPKGYKAPCSICGSNRNRQNGGHYIDSELAASIRQLLFLGRSTRTIAAELGLNKGTVDRHRRLYLAERGTFADIVCPCGQQAFHRGWCSERLKHSPARQAFLARWMEGRQRQPKLIRLPPRVVTNYPFLPSGSRASGADIVLLVNGAVPRGLPEQLRGDVCQEIIAAVLAGEFTEAEIPQHIKAIIARVRREQEGHYMAISLDAPMRDGRSWHDVLTIGNSHD